MESRRTKQLVSGSLTKPRMDSPAPPDWQRQGCGVKLHAGGRCQVVLGQWLAPDTLQHLEACRECPSEAELTTGNPGQARIPKATLKGVTPAQAFPAAPSTSCHYLPITPRLRTTKIAVSPDSCFSRAPGSTWIPSHPSDS